MLVVDRVELELLDQSDEMRHLDRRHPVRCEHDLDARDEVVQLRNLREHVVRDDEVGAATFRHERGGELRVEEVDDRLDACWRGRIGDVRGGIDAERGNAPRDEVLKQVAVVRGQLEDKARPRQPEPLGHPLRVALRVRNPGIRVRREVGVVAEDLVPGT